MFHALLLSTFLASTPVDDTPVAMKFSVTSATKDALLSGELALSPSRAASIERRASRGPEHQSLQLDVKPLDDGRLLVRALWHDISADGEEVKWQPSFIIKRRGDAEVRLDFPGGTRVLKLTAS